MMNISIITGIDDPMVNLWILIWVVGIVGAIYALFGGLKTVAVSDTLNGVGLLIGGFMIVFFGLIAVSGGEGIFEGFTILRTEIPDKLNSIGGATESVPFGTLFTGVMIINVYLISIYKYLTLCFQYLHLLKIFLSKVDLPAPFFSHQSVDFALFLNQKLTDF